MCTLTSLDNKNNLPTYKSRIAAKNAGKTKQISQNICPFRSTLKLQLQSLPAKLGEHLEQNQGLAFSYFIKIRGAMNCLFLFFLSMFKVTPLVHSIMLSHYLKNHIGQFWNDVISEQPLMENGPKAMSPSMYKKNLWKVSLTEENVPMTAVVA